MQFNRIDTAKGRYYRVTHDNGLAYNYRSVTSVVDALRPSDEFHGWYIKLAKDKLGQDTQLSDKELIEFGYKESKIISKEALEKGTKYHEIVEHYYKNKVFNPSITYCDRLSKIGDLLDNSDLLCSETKVFYYEFCDSYGNPSNYNTPIGYAGTFDAVLKLNCCLVSKEGNEVVTPNSQVLVDWKFVKKRKYPKSMYYGQTKYPFIGYSLQLSAYKKAIDQMKGLQVDGVILVVCPEEGKQGYLYFYSKEDLEFYFNWFRKGLIDVNYFNDPALFDWNEMCSQADSENRLGERVYAKFA